MAARDKSPRKIRVLVIDDSAPIRRLLTSIIGASPDFEVVGAAPDPIVAREMIRSLNPNLLPLAQMAPHLIAVLGTSRAIRL
jgi:two-component system chemotaxis response regulator CheB